MVSDIARQCVLPRWQVVSRWTSSCHIFATPPLCEQKLKPGFDKFCTNIKREALQQLRVYNKARSRRIMQEQELGLLHGKQPRANNITKPPTENVRDSFLHNIITFLRTTRTADLQARVDLVRCDDGREDLPVVTGILDCLWDLDLLDIIWALEDIDIETGGHVPCDVAMQWPDTGVVSLKLDHSVSWRAGVWIGFAQDLNVTTGWVGWVGDGSIPNAIAFGEDFYK
jgi:hypothetical protein